MKNLWKDLDELQPEIKNPIDIIKAQSEYLKEGTNNIFYINDIEIVRSGKMAEDVLKSQNLNGQFRYRVDICSEYLKEYSFNILGIYYDISFYPFVLNVPGEITESIVEEHNKEAILKNELRGFFLVESQEEFEEILTIIFNCPEVRMVMKNMKAIIGNIEENEW